LRLDVPGHAGGSVAVSFSPDGDLLVTSGNDGMVRIWSLATGEVVAALDGRSSWLSRIAFSADGRILAAVGGDNHIRVWDMDGIGEAGADRPHHYGGPRTQVRLRIGTRTTDPEQSRAPMRRQSR
jgi:WD40 repeat protein